MSSLLSNPVNQAHIDDLKARLNDHLSVAPGPATLEALSLVGQLSGIVQAMDTGALSPGDVQARFTEHAIPGFCFRRWLAEMVEECIYPEAALHEVA